MRGTLRALNVTTQHVAELEQLETAVTGYVRQTVFAELLAEFELLRNVVAELFAQLVEMDAAGTPAGTDPRN